MNAVRNDNANESVNKLFGKLFVSEAVRVRVRMCLCVYVVCVSECGCTHMGACVCVSVYECVRVGKTV